MGSSALERRSAAVAGPVLRLRTRFPCGGSTPSGRCRRAAFLAREASLQAPREQPRSFPPARRSHSEGAAPSVPTFRLEPLTPSAGTRAGQARPGPALPALPCPLLLLLPRAVTPAHCERARREGRGLLCACARRPSAAVGVPHSPVSGSVARAQWLPRPSRFPQRRRRCRHRRSQPRAMGSEKDLEEPPRPAPPQDCAKSGPGVAGGGAGRGGLRPRAPRRRRLLGFQSVFSAAAAAAASSSGAGVVRRRRAKAAKAPSPEPPPPLPAPEGERGTGAERARPAEAAEEQQREGPPAAPVPSASASPAPPPPAPRDSDGGGAGAEAEEAAPPELECPLCLERQPAGNAPRLLSCPHRSCRACLRQYLRIEISESRVNISCPACSERLNPADIRLLLRDSPGLVAKYEEFMLRRCLAADPDCRWCPAPDCG